MSTSTNSGAKVNVFDEAEIKRRTKRVQDLVEWQKTKEYQATQKRQDISAIQRETGLDQERAEWLYWYRRNSWLADHKQFFCEKFEERRAAAMGERSLGLRGSDGIDWDALDEQRKRSNGSSSSYGSRPRATLEEAPQPAGSLDEWDAGAEPGAIPPRQWLLGNQFCRGFISSIVAAGGCGKTALRLLQFIALATGRSLCGQHVFRRCRVLLISLEDDTHELQRRIKAVLDRYGIKRSELQGWLFCASPKLAKLAEMKNRIRAVGPLEQQIRDAITRCKPDIVSLDPFVKTHALEENDSGDMNYVCDLLARMAIEFNVAVDSPHHVHKGTVTPGDADSGRGSSGIRDAGRLVYTLVPMSETEASAFGISLEDRYSYVRLDPAKVNIAARSTKAEWFCLVGEPIGNGTAEYPNGDTVQVIEPWTPPDAWAGLSIEILNAVLSTIDRGVLEDDGRPTGQRYSSARSAKGDRAAWRVMQRFSPEKSEAQCREIIRTWEENGVLVTRNYDDPKQRREVGGLYVDETKRPGSKFA